MKKIMFVLVLVFVCMAGFGQETYSFKKPTNKADSLEINLEYTKICLGKFYEQHDIGVYFTAFGTVIAGGTGLAYSFVKSPSENDMTIFASVAGVGGVLALIGVIINWDAYKWLNRSRLKPVLTPSGAGVVINFDLFTPKYGD